MSNLIVLFNLSKEKRTKFDVEKVAEKQRLVSPGTERVNHSHFSG